MVNKLRLSVVLNVVLVLLGVGLVGYSATVENKPAVSNASKEVTTATFTVKRVVLQADWNDQFGKPGYQVVETTEGHHILRIHGGEDGKVWAGEFDYSCDLEVVVRNLGVKVTHVMCCHPAQVRIYSGANLSFFFPDHYGCLWSARYWNEGSTITIYSQNPN